MNLITSEMPVDRPRYLMGVGTPTDLLDAVALGVDKVRLTGGEPLVRRDIITLVAMLGQIEGIRDYAMTTNGTLLDEANLIAEMPPGFVIAGVLWIAFDCHDAVGADVVRVPQMRV